MEYVKNNTFLHIQREVNGTYEPLWNVGETYFIGQRKNRYFKLFDFVDKRYDPKNIESVRLALEHSTKIIRELIFEEVRKEFFPSHPSRHRCLWVIKADSPDSLNYWKNILGKTDRILKVELTGKIHKANEEYLPLSTESLNNLRQQAFHYWTGTDGEQQKEELLFEGFAKVVDILKVESYLDL